MSIPKEPRQLMINIMYLVLTALLALNVSAEIFNAFEMVDKGLNSANETLDESNASLPVTIRDRAKKNKEFEKYAERVPIVQNLSQEASEYIDALVDKLVDEAGDRNGVNDEGDYRDINGKIELKGKRDYDATTRLLVDQGLGEELKNKMLEYKEEFLNLFDEEERANYVNKIPIEIDDESWKNSQTRRDSWADFTFNHMPLGALMPIFSKFKNDIKSSEANVLNYLVKKVGGEEVVLDQFTVVSSPKKTYVIKGERFETDIFLSASAGTQNNTGVSIRVNGSPLKVGEDGVAKFTANAGATGRKTYTADISVTNPVTGEVKSYKNSFEYEVGERSVAISPTKMNVFYIGVPNPVEVSAAGVSSNQMQVNMSGAGGGTIKANADGTYVVNVTRPTKKGEFAKINVSADGLNASKDFRVKRIPDPVPTLSNKKSGVMGSGEFKIQQGIVPRLDGFDFDARCIVQEFNMVRVPKRQDPEPVRAHKGGKFNQNAARIIQKAVPGDIYYFEDIKCKCPGDVAARNVGGMVYRIK
ncbi:MAG: gliding motility protein GldM [Saprospiraceae bacterium]|nr:gliding motility protein GldM [Saprospiraceae bacterium]